MKPLVSPLPLVGLRELAKASGFSTATISRALRNSPSVQAITKNKILQKARELGYQSNPLVGQLMSSVRRRHGSDFKGNLALVWLGGCSKDHPDEGESQVQDAIINSADELGYSLSEFRLSNHSPDVLYRILKSRSVRGLLLASTPGQAPEPVVRFDLRNFACVSLGWGLSEPQLHSVRFDYYQAFQLAVQQAARVYQGGVAAVWDFEPDCKIQHAAQASFLVHHPDGPVAAQRLFLDRNTLSEKKVSALFERHGIRCVVATAKMRLPDWFHRLVPEKNMIWLGDPGPRESFGWVDTQNALAGSWGIDLLAAMIVRQECGAPGNRQVLLVPPAWRSDRKSPT